MWVDYKPIDDKYRFIDTMLIPESHLFELKFAVRDSWENRRGLNKAEDKHTGDFFSKSGGHPILTESTGYQPSK